MIRPSESAHLQLNSQPLSAPRAPEPSGGQPGHSGLQARSLASLESARHDLVQAVLSTRSACERTNSDTAQLLLSAAVQDLVALDDMLHELRRSGDAVRPPPMGEVPLNHIGASSVCLPTTGENAIKMSYSNERVVAKLRLEGVEEEPIRALEEIDQEIDAILRAGGTSQDVRATQRRFNELLADVRSRDCQSELRSSA